MLQKGQLTGEVGSPLLYQSKEYLELCTLPSLMGGPEDTEEKETLTRYKDPYI